MSRQQFTRYSCDVLSCPATFEIKHRDGEPQSPATWGFITVAKLRGRANISMWLCPEHFRVIDGWVYDSQYCGLGPCCLEGGHEGGCKQ